MQTRWEAVVAADEGWLIGADGQIPWRLPGDLRRFKRVTMGHPLIMGRRTHESIGRALPGRRNLVLTRQASYQPAEGAEVVTSLERARQEVQGAEAAMVIGGAGVYEAFLSALDRVHLTVVAGQRQGDTYMPSLCPEDWEVLEREDVPGSGERPAHVFLVLERAACGRPLEPGPAEVPAGWRPQV